MNQMKTLTLEIPEHINEKKFKMSIAAMLFDQGILTSSQAAKLIDITKREFIENVGNYGVSIFGETDEDLRIEVLI